MSHVQRHVTRRIIMKSKILLVGTSALIASVAGASAMEYKPFVGVGMGIQGMIYDDAIEDNAEYYLPKDFVAFGIEGGARFGSYNKIYNGGFSINVDTSDSEKMTYKFTDEVYAKIKTTALTATYDNFFRISGDKIKRIDLVLGAGTGAMNYHLDSQTAKRDDETSWSTVLAFKAGLDFELTKNLTLSATMRWLVPTREHYNVASSYIAGGAIKYMF